MEDKSNSFLLQDSKDYSAKGIKNKYRDTNLEYSDGDIELYPIRSTNRHSHQQETNGVSDDNPTKSFYKVSTSTSDSLISDQPIDNFNDLDPKEVLYYSKGNYYRVPDNIDLTNLKKTTGSPPKIVYLICFVELAERASYYGITGCLTNFIQRSLPDNGNGWGAPPVNSQQNAGGLGLGLQLASFLNQMLTFLAYLLPLYGGYLSDTKWGKMKSIWFGTIIGALGHIILVIATIPFIMSNVLLSVSLTFISIVLIGISAGFIKPNLLPLVMDQYFPRHNVIKNIVENEGNLEMNYDQDNLIFIDYKATLNQICSNFYFAINIGCFFSITTSYLEKKYGFFMAFGLPGLIYCLLPILLYFIEPKLILSNDISGKSIFDEIIPIFKVGFQTGWYQRYKNNEFWPYVKDFFKFNSSVTEDLINDVIKTIESCSIFAYFIIFNLNDGSINSIQVNQAGSMVTDGLSNDFYQSFNPLAIVILIPILDYIVYPMLTKYRIEFKSYNRITLGFLLAAIGSIIGAILQELIYRTSPCGYFATDCEIEPRVAPMNAIWDSLMFSLQAIGECFATITAYELAYTRSPDKMEGFVIALFLFTNAISAVLGEFISIFAFDPYLTLIFTFCGGLGLIFAILFYFNFRNKL
ncbi:hypothetical protein B5S28_g1080 [[Candida] boidinii]|nr:hypothetical protein B5S28_g1080 [[Candida] boidinii]